MQGICNGKNFTENGLIEFLETAAEEFTQAGMFEAVNEVNYSLCPVFFSNVAFPKFWPGF